jgi:polysaccharide deacetylase 2 family uncharacterized protein YibQ
MFLEDGMGLRDLFRRNTVNDPFGGDDGFDDGESRFEGQGPKIALIASGVLFLVLLGGGAAILLTGDENAAAPPVMGSLADLEIVEDEDLAAAPAQIAAPSTAAPVIADSTAATDRSIERRPWLSATAPAAPRPGVDAKPAAPAATAAKPLVTPATPPAAAQAKTAPPAPAAAVKPATPPPPVAKPADVKTAEAKPAVIAPPPATAPATAAKTATPAPAPTPAAAPAAQTAEAQPQSAAAAALLATLPAEDEIPDPARDIAGIPALRPADEAPGAPRRFDAPTGDAGPAIAGGRPRLVEPPLPPTDRIAIAAPPPRYANLTDIKATKIDTPPASATKVAFIVDGLGLSQSATTAAINKLPPSVTLAFSPYARNLKNWIEQAKAKGHEVLIEVPMESKQFPAEDPGPLGLLTSIEAKENQERLEAILKESAGTVGVLDTMGSKFRESGEHINPVFAKLKQSNLVYVQGTPGVRVGEASVPTAIADLIVDERPFRAAIDARLDYAERLARYQGSAVVTMGAKPVNFERLILWAEQAQKKGIALAPISQVLITQ